MKLSFKKELSIKIYLELARYHLESCFEALELKEQTSTSILFKDYLLFCVQAYQLNLPSKTIFKRINEEYFCSYYDFAFLMLHQINSNFKKIEEIDEKDENYMIFSKLPQLKIVDLQNFFVETFKMYIYEKET